MNPEVKELKKEYVLDCANVYIVDIDKLQVNILVQTDYNAGVLFSKIDFIDNVQNVIAALDEYEQLSNALLIELGFKSTLENVEQLQGAILEKQKKLALSTFHNRIEEILSDSNLKIKFSKETLNKLVENGFLDNNYTLTPKGKRVIKLQEYGFNHNLHPLAYIHTTEEELFDKGKDIRTVTFGGYKYVTNAEHSIFEDSDKVNIELSENVIEEQEYEPLLIQGICKNSKMFEYMPYAYCPMLGIEDENLGYLSTKQLGIVVFKQKDSDTNIYINSLNLQYLYNKHGKDLQFFEIESMQGYLYVYSKDLVAILPQENCSAKWIKENKFSNYDSQEILELVKQQK